MAIVADSQSKAVLFTGVTVLLPLSFFTSYFGMNLRGLAETDRDENCSWTLCGSNRVRDGAGHGICLPEGHHTEGGA